jgi:hypothetical protein
MKTCSVKNSKNNFLYAQPATTPYKHQTQSTNPLSPLSVIISFIFAFPFLWKFIEIHCAANQIKLPAIIPLPFPSFFVGFDNSKPTKSQWL